LANWLRSSDQSGGGAASALKWLSFRGSLNSEAAAVSASDVVEVSLNVAGSNLRAVASKSSIEVSAITVGKELCGGSDAYWGGGNGSLGRKAACAVGA